MRWLALLGFLLILSCETESEEPTGVPMPLAVGNWWFYEAEGPDSLYHVTDTLADSVDFAGYNAYLMLHRTPDGTDTLYVYYDDQDYLVWADPGNTDTLFNRMAKKNMMPGDTWYMEEGSTVLMKVGDEDSLSLPAGVFDALPVLMISSSGDTMAIHWFTTGTGRVQHQDFSGFYHRLSDYHLN